MIRRVRRAGHTRVTRGDPRRSAGLAQAAGCSWASPRARGAPAAPFPARERVEEMRARGNGNVTRAQRLAAPESLLRWLTRHEWIPAGGAADGAPHAAQLRAH